MIDGGHSSKIDATIYKAYRVAAVENVLAARARHSHIAPECFSIHGTVATKTMDIYSLGVLMQRTLSRVPPFFPEIDALWRVCRNERAEHRPSLAWLKEQLLALQHGVSSEQLFISSVARLLQPMNILKENFLMASLHAQPTNVQTILRFIHRCTPQDQQTIFQQTNTFNYNALMLATRYHPEFVQPLLDVIRTFSHAIQMNILMQQGTDQNTALVIASAYAAPSVIGALLSHLDSLLPKRKGTDPFVEPYPTMPSDYTRTPKKIKIVDEKSTSAFFAPNPTTTPKARVCNAPTMPPRFTMG